METTEHRIEWGEGIAVEGDTIEWAFDADRVRAEIMATYALVAPELAATIAPDAPLDGLAALVAGEVRDYVKRMATAQVAARADGAREMRSRAAQVAGDSRVVAGMPSRAEILTREILELPLTGGA